jgi:DNA invertase Pin-like site-specific DNA recombinase
MPRNIAYLRVSTLEQDNSKNKTDILSLANEKGLGKVEFVEDKISGKVSWKERQIFTVLNQLQKGDVLLISEFSRLGRSMLEIMEIILFAIEKEIKMYTVKGNWQLDDTIQSKIMAMVFAMAAEIERDLISQRTKEALRVKKANGMILGRPKGPGKSKLDTYRVEIEALLKNGSKQSFIANRYGATEATLSNWITKNKIVKPKSKRI